MRGRLLLAGLGVAAGVSPLVAQFPPPPARVTPPYRPLTPPIQIPRLPEPTKPTGSSGTFPTPSPVVPASATFPTAPPGTPAPPRSLPPGLTPATPQPPAVAPAPQVLPDGSAVLPTPAEVPLPHPENKQPLDAGSVTTRRVADNWQVLAGGRVLKDLGADETGAKDVVRVLRELRPTEWAAIGSPRPVVEYGLTNGRPPVTGGFPRAVVPIDFRTVRVEAVRGVWCLRDDGNILFNFGLHKADADQALAVVRKYGFNRIGSVGGSVTAPALTYFFAALESDGAQPVATSPLVAAAQENSLTRTGIPVPGVGYFGEMVSIDPRKLDVRRAGSEWVVASGSEILARCGPAEWTARDVARVIQDGRFTEFCRAGSAGLTFFLVNGKAPTRVPLAVQGRTFDRTALRVQQYGTKWAVTENGRHLFDAAGPEEGESMVRLVRAYGLDQLCQVGTSPRYGLTFLAKSGR